MPFFHRFYFAWFAVGILLACGDGPAAADYPSVVVAEAERHRVGELALAQPGVPTEIYREVLREYRWQLKPEYGEAVKDKDRFLPDLRRPGQETTWQVSVPESYVPGDPHGVLVFVNAGGSGQVHPSIHPELGPRKLIAIGANHAGNPQDPAFRHAAAVHAVQLVRDRYDLDEDRVYIHGLSGGGRITSRVIFIHGHVFDGAVCIIGVDPYLQIPADQGPNTVYRGFWRNANRKRLEHVRRSNRIVLLTGQRDTNRHGTLQVFNAYEKQGFAHLSYLEEPGLGHTWPSGRFLAQALDLLDAPLFEGLGKAYEAALRAERDGDLAEARRGFTRAAKYGRDQPWVEDARDKADGLQARHDADLAEIEVLFADAEIKTPQLVKAINRFRKTWGRDGPVVDELRRKIAERRAGSAAD